MKKYYIYLNGKQYMELPEKFGIKQDVYMNYNSIIDTYLKGRGVGGVATWDKKIQVLSGFITNPTFLDQLIRHELTHIKQMGKTDFQKKYIEATKLVPHWENPYEIEAEDWGRRNWMQLHRVGKFDIYQQKFLEKWQKEYPEVFKSWAEYERTSKEMLSRGETMPGFAGQKRESEQSLAKAIKQVKKYGGEPEIPKTVGKWQEDYLTKEAVEILKKRLSKFSKW